MKENLKGKERWNGLTKEYIKVSSSEVNLVAQAASSMLRV